MEAGREWKQDRIVASTQEGKSDSWSNVAKRFRDPQPPQFRTAASVLPGLSSGGTNPHQSRRNQLTFVLLIPAIWMMPVLCSHPFRFLPAPDAKSSSGVIANRDCLRRVLSPPGVLAPPAPRPRRSPGSAAHGPEFSGRITPNQARSNRIRPNQTKKFPVFRVSHRTQRSRGKVPAALADSPNFACTSRLPRTL
jgi:hypothetical protein